MPRLQEPLQYLHGGSSGKEHQNPSSLYQLLQSSPPQQALTAHTPAPPLSRPTIQALESDLISQVAAVQSAGARSFQQRQRRRHRHAPATHSNVNKLSPGILDHHIFTKGEWQRTRLRDHPKVSITISVDTPAKARNSRSADASNTYEEVSAIADTGTQSDLWSLADFLNLWILTRRPLSRQP